MDVKTVCFAATQEFISLFEIRDLFMIAGTADLNRIAGIADLNRITGIADLNRMAGIADMNRAVREMRGKKK